MCAEGMLYILTRKCAPVGGWISNEQMCVLKGNLFQTHEQSEWLAFFLLRAPVRTDITKLGQQLYGCANHFLTNHFDMCVGGMVPLCALKYAAADSTDMNLKVCALTGDRRNNPMLDVCWRVYDTQMCVLAGVNNVLRCNHVCWRVLTCILNMSRCVLAGCRYLQSISGESLMWSNQHWCVCWRVIILFFTRKNVCWRETSWFNDWICVLAGATSQWGNEYVWWQANLRKKKQSVCWRVHWQERCCRAGHNLDEHVFIPTAHT